MAPSAQTELALVLLAIAPPYRKNDDAGESVRVPIIDGIVVAFKKRYPSIFVSAAEDKRRCAALDAKIAQEKVRKLDRGHADNKDE